MGKLIVNHAGKEKGFDILDEVAFVGSAPDNAIRVQGEGVAPKHCQILHVEGSYRVVDLGSPAGTIVNGVRIAHHALKNGDVVQVGATAMTFRGGVVPQGAAAPGTPAPAPGVPRVAAAAGMTPRAGSSRRTTASGRREAPEIHVSPALQRAASGREVLTRKNVRKTGLPTAAVAAIAVGAVALVVLAGWQVMKSTAPATAVTIAYENANKALANREYQKARDWIATIPKDAPNYEYAQQLLAEINELTGSAAQDHALHKKGETDYQNNILGFIDQHVEKSSGEKDVSEIRVLVRRCEQWLKDYPAHSRTAEVKSFLAKYQPLVPATPPTFRDVYVDADHERARQLFGKATQIIQGWIDAHPEENGEKKSAVILRDKIRGGAEDFWRLQDKDARKNIEEGNLNAAYNKYLVAIRWLDGIPDMHAAAKRLCDDLKAKVGDKAVLDDPN